MRVCVFVEVPLFVCVCVPGVSSCVCGVEGVAVYPNMGGVVGEGVVFRKCHH